MVYTDCTCYMINFGERGRELSLSVVRNCHRAGQAHIIIGIFRQWRSLTAVETIAQDRSSFVEGLRGKTSIISLLDAVQVSGCLADGHPPACLFFTHLSRFLSTLFSVREMTSRSLRKQFGGTLLNVMYYNLLDVRKPPLINCFFFLRNVNSSKLSRPPAKVLRSRDLS